MSWNKETKPDNTNSLDTRSLALSIDQNFCQVHYDDTELMNVKFYWLANTYVFMCKNLKKKNFAYGFSLTTPAVTSMFCFDSLWDER